MVFAKAMKIKAWFDSCSRVFGQAKMPMTWVTPIGLVVSQPYYQEKSETIQT